MAHNHLNGLSASLEDLSLKKQLPLRQQKDKPVLKYNASMNAPVHLFNQSDVNNYRHGINRGPFPGNVTHGRTLSSPFKSKGGASNAMAGTTSGGYAGYKNTSPQYSPAGSPNKTSSNPYSKPISANDIKQPESLIRRNSNSNPTLGTSTGPSTVKGTSSTNNNTNFLANSFMRPQSAVKPPPHPSSSSPSKLKSDTNTAVVPRPPSAPRPTSSKSRTASPCRVARNLNYTPNKPYSEVSGGDSSGGTNTPVSSSPKQSKSRPPSATSMTDGAKKMPVTNTITGTSFYKKDSKSCEKVDVRPKADGANKKISLRERLPSSCSDDGEWEDENEETEYGGSIRRPTSEREPADGEDSADSDGYDDDGDSDTCKDGEDDDVDEMIDGIDDDYDNDSDDNSDGYSITTSLSRKSSAASVTVRVKSAKQRLTLKDVVKDNWSATDEVQPALMASLFPNVPPTINFVPEGQKVEQLPWELRKLLKWRMSTITPNVVKHVLARSHFRVSKKNHDWIGYWGKHMKAPGFKAIREYQKVNHVPGSFQIGRKDRLWRNLSKMQVQFGKKEFGFFPQTFILPQDLKQLKRTWEDGGNKQKWIIKPPASARGIGIKVIHKWNQIPRRRPVIVQKYLSRPYLINDSKFDLRIYVYVSSMDPLRVYIYEDGLTRFASHKYSNAMKNLSNKYMHLTNYSINKKNNEYQSNSDEGACQGHKWSLRSLWTYMRKQGINTNAVWESIKDLILKTIISTESAINTLIKSNVKKRYSIHELFGFDVMLDENLKPWIIEVNISPSLHSNSQLDMSIKGNMIKDLFNISGWILPDKSEVSANQSFTDMNHYIPSNELCIDKRLWSQQLSPDERAKHAYFCQKWQDENALPEILRTLTPDDIRILVETIDEESRRGNFHRVFPSASSQKYMRFFDSPRYYNILNMQWLEKYQRMEGRGIALLESYCQKGIHIENPTSNSNHQWCPPMAAAVIRDTRSLSAPSNRLHLDNRGSHASAAVLPKLKKKKKKMLHSGSLGSISTRSDASEPS
ncbi:unnamed protein product [Owenia fusiformis]|uniref:Uncharacterized protein n=1 Tax=Owenia fusiformis TaxID=6347 RepID=A0A8J1TRD8_OWEFU|nr:unnamed protein product [Owenia fusiformis]